MKLAYPEEMTPCYKFRPSDDLLESSKKAASPYKGTQIKHLNKLFMTFLDGKGFF